MAKKERVGILHGKPIVIGDKNLVTDNEIYLSSAGVSSGLTIICIVVTDDYGIVSVTINGKEYEYFINDGNFAVRDKELFESIINNKYNVRLIQEQRNSMIGSENNIIYFEHAALGFIEDNVRCVFMSLRDGSNAIEIHK